MPTELLMPTVVGPAIAEVPVAPIVDLFECVATPILAKRALSNSDLAEAKLLAFISV